MKLFGVFEKNFFKQYKSLSIDGTAKDFHLLFDDLKELLKEYGEVKK